MSSASAASACGRQVACGTTRCATEIAQAMRSFVGRTSEVGRAGRANRRRTTLSGSSHRANLVAPSQSTVWKSRARSAAGRHQSLRTGPISDLDQSPVDELLEEGEDVTLAPLRLN